MVSTIQSYTIDPTDSRSNGEYSSVLHHLLLQIQDLWWVQFSPTPSILQILGVMASTVQSYTIYAYKSVINGEYNSVLHHL